MARKDKLSKAEKKKQGIYDKPAEKADAEFGTVVPPNHEFVPWACSPQPVKKASKKKRVC